MALFKISKDQLSFEPKWRIVSKRSSSDTYAQIFNIRIATRTTKATRAWFEILISIRVGIHFCQ